MIKAAIPRNKRLNAGRSGSMQFETCKKHVQPGTFESFRPTARRAGSKMLAVLAKFNDLLTTHSLQ